MPHSPQSTRYPRYVRLLPFLLALIAGGCAAPSVNSGTTKTYYGAIAISPDEQYIAMAEKSYARVYMISSISRKKLGTFPTEGVVGDLEFTSDSRYLIGRGAGKNGSVRVWDVATGSIAGEISQNSEIKRIAVSPVANIIAAAGEDGTFRISRIPDDSVIHTLNWNPGMVMALAFSPNGKIIASGGSDRRVRFSDVATGRQLLTFDGFSEVTDLTFSPTGDTLVTVGDDIRLWRTDTLRLIENLTTPMNSFRERSTDVRLWANPNTDPTMDEISTTALKVLATPFAVLQGINPWEKAPEHPHSIAYASDGSYLVLVWPPGSAHVEVRYLRTREKVLLKSLTPYGPSDLNTIYADDFAVSASSGFVAVAGQEVHVYYPGSGTEVIPASSLRPASFQTEQSELHDGDPVAHIAISFAYKYLGKDWVASQHQADIGLGFDWRPRLWLLSFAGQAFISASPIRPSQLSSPEGASTLYEVNAGIRKVVTVWERVGIFAGGGLSLLGTYLYEDTELWGHDWGFGWWGGTGFYYALRGGTFLGANIQYTRGNTSPAGQTIVTNSFRFAFLYGGWDW